MLLSFILFYLLSVFFLTPSCLQYALYIYHSALVQHQYMMNHLLWFQFLCPTNQNVSIKIGRSFFLPSFPQTNVFGEISYEPSYAHTHRDTHFLKLIALCICSVRIVSTGAPPEPVRTVFQIPRLSPACACLHVAPF